MEKSINILNILRIEEIPYHQLFIIQEKISLNGLTKDQTIRYLFSIDYLKKIIETD